MAIVARPAGERPRAGFVGARWVLRIVLSLIGLMAAAQPISIGQYLDGRYGLLQVHSLVAAGIEQFGLLLIPIVIWYVVAGGRTWVLITMLLAAAIEVQAVMGYTRILAVHIPLGVGVVGGAIGLAIWSWTPSSGRFRPRRRAGGHPSRQHDDRSEVAVG